MIDGPMATVIVAVLGTIAVAIIKLVPSRAHDTSKCKETSDRLADAENRLTRQETHVTNMQGWMKDLKVEMHEVRTDLQKVLLAVSRDHCGRRDGDSE